MSLNIQRSQSAPHPLQALKAKAGARPAIRLQRTVSNIEFGAVDRPQASHHQYYRHHTPKIERENPFNCADFFPRRADEHEEWNWLQEEEEETQEVEEEVPYPGGRAMDEKAIKDTIAMEDKLGILALGDMLFDSKSRAEQLPLATAPEESRLVSPYTDDEPVDHEALYQSLCARREARTKMFAEDVEDGPTFGTLFFGKD
ncbi:hypothetical protein HDZ31DRAFT_60260 [Schizophyllum fasciatum]